MNAGSAPTLEIVDSLATITLRRPAQHNRIDPDDPAVLLRHLEAVRADPSVRMLVLTGKTAPPAQAVSEPRVVCASSSIGVSAEECSAKALGCPGERRGTPMHAEEAAPVVEGLGRDDAHSPGPHEAFRVVVR